MEAITDQQLDEWRAFGLRVDLQEIAWLVDEVRRLKGIARDLEQVLMETEEENELSHRRLRSQVADLLTERDELRRLLPRKLEEDSALGR